MGLDHHTQEEKKIIIFQDTFPEMASLVLMNNDPLQKPKSTRPMTYLSLPMSL